jgi:hypothetical protein
MRRIYDLVMTHLLDADDFFIHCVQRYCAEARLNFFLVEPLWVESFYDSLAEGLLWPRVLLNMHSEHHQPDEIYHRLIRLAAERNTCVIDPPDRALAAFDKARVHYRLATAGIRVPSTVVVPAERTAGFRLTEDEHALLGTPFVIKPSMGYGRRGVIMNATSETDLSRSVAAWPDRHYLLQRRIVPRQINGLPVYFRVFFVFGSVFYSWWNCYTDHYRLVTSLEAQELNLKPLEEISRQIATITGMNFFSSEIAQTDSGEFVVIDYVNDQCHMLSQSANPKIGVPDELVASIAKRLVQATQEIIAKG